MSMTRLTSALALALLALLGTSAGSACAALLLGSATSPAQSGVARRWQKIRGLAQTASIDVLTREARRDARFAIPDDLAKLQVALAWIAPEQTNGPSLATSVAAALWNLDEPLAHAAVLSLRSRGDCGVLNVILAKPSRYMSAAFAVGPTRRGLGIHFESPCPIPEPIASRVRPLLPDGVLPVLSHGNLPVVCALMWGRPEDLEGLRRMARLDEWERSDYHGGDDSLTLNAAAEDPRYLILAGPRVFALAALGDPALIEDLASGDGERAPLLTAACRLARCDRQFPTELAITTSARVLLGRESRERLYRVLAEDLRRANSPGPATWVPWPL